MWRRSFRSVWKYKIYNSAALMYLRQRACYLRWGAAGRCGGVLRLFQLAGARRLRAIAAELDTIADGGTVGLPTGYTGELADAVNTRQ